MKTKHKIIIFSTLFAIILLIIISSFLFKGNKSLTSDSLKNLINKEYVVENFIEDEQVAKLDIIGDLNKDDITNLSKKISEIENLDNIIITVFKENVSIIENGYYTDGLLAEIFIDNKNNIITYSEFKEDNLDNDIKTICLTNAEYKNLENDNGIIKIYIDSSDLTVNNVKEELYLLAETISNSNKDLKNVIITSKINELEYTISLNNPNIIKIIETIKL